MGEKRKPDSPREKKAEFKKLKIADPSPANLVSEDCASNTDRSCANSEALLQDAASATGPHSSAHLLPHESDLNSPVPAENQSSVDDRTFTQEITRAEIATEKDNDKKEYEANVNEDVVEDVLCEDNKTDEVCQPHLKKEEVEGETETRSKNGVGKLPSECDSEYEILQGSIQVNKLVKRPIEAVSPSSPTDESVKGSTSKNEDGKKPKKLKIMEVQEETGEFTASLQKTALHSEQAKELDSGACHPDSRKSSVSDSAISLEDGDAKVLNVVEFCQLTSHDQDSVLNGNCDNFAQTSKESNNKKVNFNCLRESTSANEFNNSVLLEEEINGSAQQNQEDPPIFPQKRQRKKHIINALQKLLEYYLSRGNMTRDKFLQQKVDVDDFVDLSVFLDFNKVKALTDEIKLLKYAAKNSPVLELSSDETRVKLKSGYREKKDECECTVYVDYLPRSATRDWVCHYFTQFGDVEFVSLPLFKDSKRCRGFAFVVFKVAASAELAVNSHVRRHAGGTSGPGNSHVGFIARSYVDPKETRSKVDLHRAVPDSSSQGDDEVSRREICFDNEEPGCVVTSTTTSSTTTAAAATTGSEAECAADSNNTRNRSLDYSALLIEVNGPEGLYFNSGRLPGDNAGQSLPLDAERFLTLPKRVCKNSRLKVKTKQSIVKRKLIGPGVTDRFLVISKQTWLAQRRDYLSEQKRRFGTCKAIMARERLQEEALKIEFDGPRPQKQMPVKIPGTVVKITLEKPIEDKDTLIAGIKSMGGSGVVFVDCSVGEKVFHVRFNSREGASTFKYAGAWRDKSSIIGGQEEDEFWENVQKCWIARITGPRIRKKVRGKEKIVKRWRKRKEVMEGIDSDTVLDPSTDQE